MEKTLLSTPLLKTVTFPSVRTPSTSMAKSFMSAQRAGSKDFMLKSGENERRFSSLTMSRNFFPSRTTPNRSIVFAISKCEFQISFRQSAEDRIFSRIVLPKEKSLFVEDQRKDRKS